MYQAKIKEGKLSLMRKPCNLTETVIFLEQQHGHRGNYVNKTHIFQTVDGMFFLCEDKNFPNLLAEVLSIFTSIHS